jgi:LmbE family N-acetylglucosaminyl deacetylase
MSRIVLIVSAHPDDMEIGMGGTVAKLADGQAAITSVVVTDGGRAANPFAWSEQQMADVRREEALRASPVLGVKEVLFLNEPDEAKEINYAAAKLTLVQILNRLKPTEIYTLHEQLDRHPAHRLAGKLVREAVAETGLSPKDGIWAYEVWGLFTRWDRLEYIDEHVAKKLLAIAEHRSQIASIPYGEGVLGLNRWRAIFADPQAGALRGMYAEAFLSVGLDSRVTASGR